MKLADEFPGEIELIAIGPLTNLAAAVKIDPQVEVSTLVHLSRWPLSRDYKNRIKVTEQTEITDNYGRKYERSRQYARSRYGQNFIWKKHENFQYFLGEFNFYADPEGAKIVLDEYTPMVSKMLSMLSITAMFN